MKYKETKEQLLDKESCKKNDNNRYKCMSPFFFITIHKLLIHSDFISSMEFKLQSVIDFAILITLVGNLKY